MSIVFDPSSLTISTFSHRRFLSGFYRVLGRVLPRLSQLRYFIVRESAARHNSSVVSEAYSEILPKCHFPHLLHFKLGITGRDAATKQLLEFLQRHSSHLQHLLLDIQAPTTLSAENFPMDFPVLRSFRGNVALMPYLLHKQCPLGAACFSSSSMLSLNAESVDNALDHVQRHAGDTLHNVQWIVKDFASPQLRVLARHLPNLKQLTLEHLSFVEMIDWREIDFSSLDDLLPSFRQLIWFEVCRADVPGARDPVLPLHEGNRMVNKFSSLCPKIIRARVFGGPEWIAMELQTESIKNNIVLTTPEYKSVWLPDLCGLMNDVESPWLAKWSVRLRHTHPEWIDFLRYSIIEPKLLVKVLEILSRCRISESRGR
ncbi:hypothetical protein BT96DRAFT_1021246 [Gymnopus androsaceus JB14]|uniref:F-box domain-containing protein n=1 Tax=Gymnopus androsaceus JB14 TaxID=1447944 RepID=A0A6A4HG98_9AGAR|nr:hypothetical protein BT96DRAFT_1021246 [Gymnopus androsaceus JB14]